MARTVCFIDKEGNVGVCTMEMTENVIDCDRCPFKKKYEGKEHLYFTYTYWTGELKTCFRQTILDEYPEYKPLVDYLSKITPLRDDKILKN